MEDRIKKFMDYKGISPSELADTIGVQRSNVTHVLKGRNKPSFQFIEKMLQIYPELNPRWLLVGIGNMIEGQMKQKTLFDQNYGLDIPKSEVKVDPDAKPLPENISDNVKTERNFSEKKEEANQQNFEEKSLTTQNFTFEKPIERIIVFYNDQTFKVYNPSR